MHWLHHLWFGYFVPSLWGNGPEALVQTVVYAALAVIFIPPVRHWFAGHFKGMKEHAEKLHEEALRLAEDHHKQHLDLVKAHHAEVLSTLNPQVSSINQPRTTRSSVSHRGINKDKENE